MKPEKQPKLVVKGKRKISRLKVKSTIKLHEETAFASQNPLNVKIFDISELGAKIVSYREIKKNKNVTLHFQSKDMLKSIEIKGAICWTRSIKTKDQSFALAGIKFKKVNPKIFERVATILITRTI
ncbi:MAG: PilZ domain-containing protein [Candidatus Aureabacteria bacterium]|nr:PilZ domain-containing protein [Candidatus Auribacterota bacterium]